MSKVYPLARQRLLEHFLAGTTPAITGFFVIGVSADYVQSDAHEDLSDVNPAHIVLAEQALAGETVLADGILDANDVDLAGLVPPIDLDALIVYAKWGGGELLFAYIDSSSDTSLPQSLSSTEAHYRWNAAGIFRL